LLSFFETDDEPARDHLLGTSFEVVERTMLDKSNAETNHQFLTLLDDRIATVARAIFGELTSDRPDSADNLAGARHELQQKLALIKVKEHITVREAAMLLSCSESHIRKLIRTARKNKTTRPIPYVDMEGVTVFPREALQSWASPKPQLQIVKNEAA
jgi:hypothetical protein